MTTPNKSASHKYIYPDYSFNEQEAKCYYQGAYFGDITYSDKDIIQVIRKDGNRYADGEMVTFHVKPKK